MQNMSKTENYCCRVWVLKYSVLSVFVYYNFAVSGAGLETLIRISRMLKFDIKHR